MEPLGEADVAEARGPAAPRGVALAEVGGRKSQLWGSLSLEAGGGIITGLSVKPNPTSSRLSLGSDNFCQFAQGFRVRHLGLEMCSSLVVRGSHLATA